MLIPIQGAGVSGGTVTNNYHGAGLGIVVTQTVKGEAASSLHARGQTFTTRLAEILAVSRQDINQIAREALDTEIRTFYQNAASMNTRIQLNRLFEGGVAIRHKAQTWAKHSASVGTTEETRVPRDLEVTKGDSFLIMADVLKAALALNRTDGTSCVQEIDLGFATSGTFVLWLTYNGYVLPTSAIPYNASASDVQTALRSLTNVPSPDCITVSTNPPGGGAPPIAGGPYYVTFSGAMGARYIQPLMLDATGLTDAVPIVTIITPGSAAGSFNSNDVNAELKVNGTIVPISSFDYQEPVGKLGSLLNVVLTIPDVNQVPIGASITFSLTVGTSRKTYISNGKLSGRNYRMSFKAGKDGGPTDQVTFSAIDVIADKFTLAPRESVIMFDPNKIQFSSIETRLDNAVLNEGFQPIFPVYEYVSGLTMLTALRRAYSSSGGYSLMSLLSSELMARLLSFGNYYGSPITDQVGLGFSNVITNIPDYNITKAEFSLEAGWHAGAQGLVGMYDPLYLPVGNILYILNKEFAIPFGALPRVIPISQPTSISNSVPIKPDANAILVTYQISPYDDPLESTYWDYKYEENTDVNNGSRTYTRTRIRQKKLLADPTQILMEQIVEVLVEVRVPFDGLETLIHRETTTMTYDDEVKIGHVKEVEALTLVGGSIGGTVDISGQIERLILRETNETHWKEDPNNAGQKIMTRSYTLTEGLIYVSNQLTASVTDPNGITVTYATRIGAALAQSSGILLADSAAESLGTVIWGEIESTEETLRHTQGNEYDVQVVIIDYLNNTTKRSTTTPRTGSTGVNPYANKSKTMLIRDLVSEGLIGPRIPMSINTGELPYYRAIALAKQILYRTHHPLESTQMPLADVDFALAKGSVIIGQNRYTYTNRHMVVGLSIKGNNLGKHGHRITMDIEAEELPA